MPGKQPLQLLVLHCTATPAGRPVSADQIRQWHLGPGTNPNGTIRFMGKDYAALSAIPPQLVGGVSVYKLGNKNRGWSRPGYSDMIHLNGAIENLVPYNNDELVDPWELTNGVRGINERARHAVYVGGKSADNLRDEDTRTPEQLATLLAYVKKWIELVPTIQVAGHNQFDAKACPCFSVVQWALANGIDPKNIYKSETKRASKL